MATFADQSPIQVLMAEMGVTEEDVARRRRIVGLQPEDLRGIALVKDIVSAEVDSLVPAFFDYLADVDEGRVVTGNRAIAERARQLKRDHVLAMVAGSYDRDYVLQRLELATLYSKAGLDLRLFIGAFDHLLAAIGSNIMKHAGQDFVGAFQHFMSLKKVASFDLGLMVDAMVVARERVIRQQQEEIRELSTPVLQVRERMLLLPIIGVIDTHRARLITQGLLEAIRGSRAKVVVVDVTGVATIDSKVANHLIQTVTAAKLMGATVIVTGLSAEVAQSLVALGIDVTKLNTAGDLQGGMEEAELCLGYKVVWDESVRGRQGAASPRLVD